MEGRSSTAEDDAESAAPTTTSNVTWEVEPHFDLPTLFPYHLPSGYSVHDLGGASTTIGTPSEISSVTSTRPHVQRLESLGIYSVVEELHQQQLKTRRPKMRLREGILGRQHKLSRTVREEKQDVLEILVEDLKDDPDPMSSSSTRSSSRSRRSSSGSASAERELASRQKRIGLLALQLGKGPAALEALTEYATKMGEIKGEKHIKVATAYLQLGQLQNDLGFYEEAHQCLSKALKGFQALSQNHQAATCLVSIGRTHLNLGNQDEAMDCLSKANNLLLGQENKDVLYLMGLASSDAKQALHLFTQGYEIHCRNGDYPRQLECMLSIGDVYCQIQDYNKAEKWLADCLELAKKRFGKPIEQRYYTARVYMAKGDLYASQQQVEALDCYHEALSLGMSLSQLSNGEETEMVAEAEVALGDFYCIQGDNELAFSYFDQTANPSSSPLYRHVTLKMAILSFRAGDISKALERFQAYGENKPTKPNAAAFTALVSQGVCQYLKGNKSKAKKLYKEAFDVAPENSNEAKTALKRSVSKLSRINFGKVFGRRTRRDNGSLGAILE